MTPARSPRATPAKAAAIAPTKGAAKSTARKVPVKRLTKSAAALRSGAGPIQKKTVALIKAMPVDRRESPLAPLALHLSKALDDTKSARDIATVSRELRAVIAQLTEGVAKPTKDAIDDLARQRAARRKAAAG